MNNNKNNNENLNNNEIILGYVKTIIKFINDENLIETKNINNDFYTNTIKNKFNDFSVRYPGLFNLILNDPNNFEFERLIQMLNLKNSVENKTKSYENASKEIGQTYYDEFVKNKVDSL